MIDAVIVFAAMGLWASGIPRCIDSVIMCCSAEEPTSSASAIHEASATIVMSPAVDAPIIEMPKVQIGCDSHQESEFEDIPVAKPISNCRS
jgi:hypothetical protein